MAESSALKTPPARRSPVLAIVGRPNVGKSTLFNKLLGERKAIVDDSPGVTRDRNYGEAEWAGRKFQLIDTGGLDTDAEGGLEESVQKQSRLALREADVILFLFDGKGGLNPLDREAVGLLRKEDKPVLFAVNKIDSRQRADNLYEFYALGIDPLFSISAEHGLGISDLMDEVVQQFPNAEESDEKTEEKAPLRISVVGRPNVGKSTLINRLLGFERSVVDSTPGTTRDALDTPFKLEGEPCRAGGYGRHSSQSADQRSAGTVQRESFPPLRGSRRSRHSHPGRCGRGHGSRRTDSELRLPARQGAALGCKQMGRGLEERCGRGELQGRSLSPAFVFGFRSRDFYFGGDGLRRAQDVRDGGRCAAGLRQESFDLRHEPSIAADRQSSRSASVAGQTGEILLWDTDRDASADLYFVRQYAAGSSGELSALLDSSVARTLGARVRAHSASIASSAGGAKKEKEMIEFGANPIRVFRRNNFVRKIF